MGEKDHRTLVTYVPFLFGKKQDFYRRRKLNSILNSALEVRVNENEKHRPSVHCGWAHQHRQWKEWGVKTWWEQRDKNQQRTKGVKTMVTWGRSVLKDERSQLHLRSKSCAYVALQTLQDSSSQSLKVIIFWLAVQRVIYISLNDSQNTKIAVVGLLCIFWMEGCVTKDL